MDQVPLPENRWVSLWTWLDESGMTIKASEQKQKSTPVSNFLQMSPSKEQSSCISSAPWDPGPTVTLFTCVHGLSQGYANSQKSQVIGLVQLLMDREMWWSQDAVHGFSVFHSEVGGTEYKSTGQQTSNWNYMFMMLFSFTNL